MSRAVLQLVLAGAGTALAGVAAAADEPTVRFEYRPIGFQLDPGETPRKHQPEIMAGGVAVFDFDSDGLLDVFFANGARMPDLDKSDQRFHNRLYRNTGGAVFEDVTEKAGVAGAGFDIGAAAGDYDNDGCPDLFVAGVRRNTLYHNNCDGTFADVSAAAGFNRPDPKYGTLWAVDAAWVDADRDGFLDLFVANYCVWDPRTETLCQADGLLDYCHPSNYDGLPNSLYRNKGDGTFTDISTPSGLRQHIGKGMGVAIADYDDDGEMDIYVANDTEPNFLFHNLGGGRFEEVGIEAGVALKDHGMPVSAMGADVRDLDNDGRPDIFFTAMRDETFPIFRNLGGGLFEENSYDTRLAVLTARMSGWSAGAADFDNDGWKDLFIARGDVLSRSGPRGALVNETNSVFRNTGGRFEDVSREAGLQTREPRQYRGTGFGDLDNDGRIDVVVSALYAPAEVWMNRGAPGNHWLRVRLRGAKSNRDGIGARLKLTAAGGSTQWNHATTSVGYASASDRRVHFGLGREHRVKLLEVRWPSGALQRLENLDADREIEVVEPE
jgi:hypothetical protein